VARAALRVADATKLVWPGAVCCTCAAGCRPRGFQGQMETVE
jgi:hypothetical protein